MKQLSNQALAWLSLIFEERFGHSFNLKSVKDGISMTLVNQSEGEIVFPHTFPEFFESCSDIPCTTWDAEAEGWESVLKEPLPAPGIIHLASKLIEYDQLISSKIYIKYDILGLTYWILNRIEEIGRTDLDNHERFPAINSHAYKYGYLERPIIDEWFNILMQVIKLMWPSIKLKENKFTIKLSHDVDRPSRYGFVTLSGLLRSVGGDILQHRNISSIIQGPLIRLNTKNKLHPADIYNTFDWIMDLSELNNYKSAFYFICGRTDNHKDAAYEPEHTAIKELMCRIHKRGHEIGLHPSYNTYQNRNLIIKEFQKLKKVCDEEGINQEKWGGRMHYLRWEHPNTMQAWNDAGLTYDSTLGYADRPGFRCGTCFEYPAFNPVTLQQLTLRIRPLIAMEGSVMSTAYLGLGESDKALNYFLQLKETCKKVSGCFTLLWHNSELDTNFKKLIYKKVVEQ